MITALVILAVRWLVCGRYTRCMVCGTIASNASPDGGPGAVCDDHYDRLNGNDWP